MGLFCLLHRTLIATARQQEEAEEEEGIYIKKEKRTICSEGIKKKSQLAQLLRFGMEAQALIPAINLLLDSG
jgi:hypothetical protein